MISQQARQYYLQNLGIDCYFPRGELLGSAASNPYSDQDQILDDQESERTPDEYLQHSLAEISGAANDVSMRESRLAVDTKSIDSKNTDTKNTEAKNKAAGLVKASFDLGAPVKARSVENDGTVAASSQSGKAVVHHFSLAVWRLNSKLMIVDSRNTRLALPTTALLANILHALGYSEVLPNFETVRWPLASDRSRNTSSSEEEARGFFQAYLQAQFEKHPSETVLLMGAHAARYGLSGEQWADAGQNPKQEAELLGKVFDLATKQKAIVVPSLAAMLQKSQLKVIAWRAILNLKVK